MRIAGMALATGGLVWLFLPGASAPALHGAALMVLAGGSWGVYSVRGRGSKRPLEDTAANFLYAIPLAVVLLLIARSSHHVDRPGVLAAMASGAVASGMGYTLWYAALRGLARTTAATVQLSVPVIAAVAGLVILGEHPSLRLVIAAIAILGGIALVILGRSGLRGGR